jgi:protein ImuB
MSAPEPRVMVLCCPALSASGRPAAQAFEQVLTAVTAFCPRVEAVEPGVCAFGARGPARYFGGETELAGRIVAAVADLGVQARIGVADGLFAAQLAAAQLAAAQLAAVQLAAVQSAAVQPAAVQPAAVQAAAVQVATRGARSARGRPVLVIPPGRTAEFLARQPVSVLADQDLAGQDLVGLLNRLGLRTLGDLAALPAGDVASRFGATGETVHRLARGLGSRPLVVRRPAEDLSVTREFDPPEALAEPVVFAAKALAERMHEGLTARGLTSVRVQVRVISADGRESRRLWRHDGLLSAAAVADRVRWQLDGWRIPVGPVNDADPAEAGITVLRLVPDQVVHATGHQLALWGETVVSDRVARAAMRVQAILGHEAVLRPVLGGGRDVSEQVNHVPFGEKRQPRLGVGPPWPGRIMGAAPGVVYPFAREADVTDEAGDTVTVTGRCVISGAPAWLAADGEPALRITGWAGPWPLSERWWDRAAARRRARFQLLTSDGRAWLAAVQDGRWLIEAGYLLWAGTTRRCPGASSGGGWPGAPGTSRLPSSTPPPNHLPCGWSGPPRPPSRGPSCTATPRTASWTGRPRPASSSPRPPGSGSRRSPSPTMTGCTGSRSSRRPPRGSVTRGSACARCSAPRSASVCRPGKPACPTRRAGICWSWPATPKATGGCARSSALPSWRAGRRDVRSTTPARWPARTAVTG